MKIFNALLFVTGLLTLYAFVRKPNPAKKNTTTKKSVYDFVVRDINHEKFDFATLKGKKIMIVNTASKCGLTPQYEQLEKIYQTYKDSHNFIIIGFPSNDFMGQEPGTEAEIVSFCQLNYGVTFPLMEKISVKGKKIHELYQFLTSKAQNGLMDAEVKWNFQKYLIGRNGQLEKVIGPRTKPDDQEIINWIKE